MFKLKGAKTKRAGDFLKRLPRRLAERAFLTFLGLLVFSLLIGGAVFYKYGYLAKRTRATIVKRPMKFKELSYKNILKIWQKREEKFKKADLKEYPNPFK